MDDFPKDLFQQLYLRSPNDADRNRLVAIKSNLGLSSHDEMWALIMTLDHYAAINQAARNIMIKEINVVLDQIKKIPERAGPVALAEAHKAIAQTVDGAAERISQLTVKKSETLAGRISKRQLMTAAIIGALITCAVAAAASTATYFFLDAYGICGSSIVMTETGPACFLFDEYPS